MSGGGLVTEAEAAKIACWRLLDKAKVAPVRSTEGAIVSQPRFRGCLGSRCMAWRWGHGGELGRSGYCGLAGMPDTPAGSGR